VREECNEGDSNGRGSIGESQSDKEFAVPCFCVRIVRFKSPHTRLAFSVIHSFRQQVAVVLVVVMHFLATSSLSLSLSLFHLEQHKYIQTRMTFNCVTFRKFAQATDRAFAGDRPRAKRQLCSQHVRRYRRQTNVGASV
jgi:hypothetical protein